MLVPRVQGWQEDAAALAGAGADRERALGRDGRAARASRSGCAFSDGWVEEAAALTSRRKLPTRRRTPTSPRASVFALNFWDANSTKALHIGHLRNLALGNALGAALTEAGGKVERRSIICDVGRSMGEAMAGVVAQRPPPQSSPEQRREERPLRRLLLRRLRQERAASHRPGSPTTTPPTR